jgi:hypothetical protein
MPAVVPSPRGTSGPCSCEPLGARDVETQGRVDPAGRYPRPELPMVFDALSSADAKTS